MASTIYFQAFSFLEKELTALGIPTRDPALSIQPEETLIDLIRRLGIPETMVEAAFVNRKIAPLETPLHSGDRVALVPPGTPGPHRVLLGIRKER